MQNSTCLSAAIICLWIGAAAQAAQYEFATLTFPDGGIRWVDKSGTHSDSSKNSPAGDLFSLLSGEDKKLANSAQYKVLVLNGLSKAGWELVQVSEVSGAQNYLFKRELNSALAAAAKPGDANKPEAPKTDAPKPDATKSESTVDGTKVSLAITGGHDTDPRDHGRPVILIAAALKVPDAVFRETFTHVTPAPGGAEPQEAQVRKNKQALMQGLSPYGVTDERLNQVSNFYRYSGSRGQMWRNTPAAGYAMVRDGVVTGIMLTNAGAGYSSPPTVSIPSMGNVELKATLAFGTEFDKNGSIKEVAVVPAPAKK